MSEAKTEAAPSAPAEGAPKPAAKGPALPLVLGVSAGTLVAGAALGLLLVAPRVTAMRAASSPAAQAAAHGEEDAHAGDDGKEKGHGGKEKGGHEKPSGYRMDNIIVNPAGSNGTRFLMASVAIEVDNPKLSAVLKERDVPLRDAVISTIERQTLDDLTRLGARDSLRLQLVKALTPVVGARPRVYLPQFVLQ